MTFETEMVMQRRWPRREEKSFKKEKGGAADLEPMREEENNSPVI